MGTRVITITDVMDVRVGDVVTCASVDEPTTTMTGRVAKVDLPRLRLAGHEGGPTSYDPYHFRFVSATREVPDVEPGTVGTSTVRGVEGVRVMRMDASERAWTSPVAVRGDHRHPESEVTDFVPDPDTAALRAEVARNRADLDAAATMRERLERESAGYRADAMTHLADARRLSARADAAKARLARLTEDNIADTIIERTSNGGGPHDAALAILALVAADEQAAEGEAAPWLYKAGEQILADDFDRGVTPENLPNILDAAPVGTVLSNSPGEPSPWEKRADGWHITTCNEVCHPVSSAFLAEYGPLTVVSVGGA